MHALVKDGAIAKYPYTIGMLRKDNPNTSFPKNPADSLLVDWGMQPVVKVDRPSVDRTKNVSEGTPVLLNGSWTQVWEVTDASAEEIADRLAREQAAVEDLRQRAYQKESDPLFFKWQRGEVTEQVWLDKVAEIKARYPDPV